jgi:hypothetical protein
MARAKLALALLLLTAQAVMLALALFFPRVDAQYRAYYITRTSPCWGIDRTDARGTSCRGRPLPPRGPVEATLQ